MRHDDDVRGIDVLLPAQQPGRWSPVDVGGVEAAQQGQLFGARETIKSPIAARFRRVVAGAQTLLAGRVVLLLRRLLVQVTVLGAQYRHYGARRSWRWQRWELRGVRLAFLVVASLEQLPPPYRRRWDVVAADRRHGHHLEQRCHVN